MAHRLTPLERRTQPDSDPAASMSLLQSLLYDPLNYGYSADTKESTLHKDPLDRAVVLLLAIILAFITTVSVRSLVAPDRPGNQVHHGLIRQIENRQADVNRLQTEVDKLNGQIGVLSAADTSAPRVPPEIRQLAQLDTITGPGLTVTVTEANDASGKGKVQDSDLRALINALWAGGAEGVSLNDIRVGPTTAVRTAGGAILVDFHAVSSPYTVQAIGDSLQMQQSLTSGNTGEYFSLLYSMYGISLSYSKQDTIALKAANVRNASVASVTNGGKEQE
ncbi:MAG: DUF881 domain-containing protein [Actinomycetaceae bacterium]|nr:DUF881 domain-containing protein [Actinomycetaceae bacterium]